MSTEFYTGVIDPNGKNAKSMAAIDAAVNKTTYDPKRWQAELDGRSEVYLGAWNDSEELVAQIAVRDWTYGDQRVFEQFAQRFRDLREGRGRGEAFDGNPLGGFALATISGGDSSRPYMDLFDEQRRSAGALLDHVIAAASGREIRMGLQWHRPTDRPSFYVATSKNFEYTEKFGHYAHVLHRLLIRPGDDVADVNSDGA